MKQYKLFETKTEDVDSKGRVVVAANAISNVDSDRDMSMPGSFDKTLNENFKRVKWFLNHRSDQLLGVPIEGKQEGTYLKMTGQLNMDKQIAKDIYSDYKLYAEYGKTLEHSIGVEAIKKETKGDIRYVSEWKLWEYSTLTAWGANEDTPMLGIKSESSLSEAIAWLEIKLKKGDYTDERFKEIEKHLSILKTLSAEPGAPTYKTEPGKLIATIDKFITSI